MKKLFTKTIQLGFSLLADKQDFVCVKVFSALLLLFYLGISNTYAQMPKISYPTPQVFAVGQAISVSPANTGGAMVAPSMSAIAGGYHDTRGIAVDASGNVYIADLSTNVVKELPFGASSPIAIGSGFNYATGLAVDASGNVYVADYDNHAIKKITAGNGAVVTIATTLGGPYGIALDGHGYIYFTDDTNGLVQKIPVGGGTAVSLGTGFVQPTGIALDAAGNVYVTDIGNNTIEKILASDGSMVMVTKGNGGLWGIAVDAAGNIYFADQYRRYITEISAADGRQIPVGELLLQPHAVALDNHNNIFMGNTGYHVVDKLSLNPWGYTISPALPAGLTINHSSGVISGTVSTPVAAKNYTVTAKNISGSGSASINISVVDVRKLLTSLRLSAGTLTPAFSSGIINYSAKVGNGVSSLTVTPATNVSGAAITVNGVSVTPGTASGPISLSVGTNTISVVVTASDGVTKQTYTVVVTRAPSSNANLSTLGPSVTPLTPTFTAANTGYTLIVPYSTAAMTVKPVTSDATATIKVNGTSLASGTTSAPVALAEGTTTAINIAVTAQDGTTTRTYTLTVNRGPSTNASLASMNPSITPLTPTFTPATTSYTLSVANSKTSMTVRPITSDVNATITVDGTANPSGTTSAPIALAVGSNTISVVVTAQDGTTTRTYTITVTRAAGPIANFDDGISVTKPTETATLAEDGILVHQAISPNGDGINDFLQIENINQYPDNKLTIMNRSGQMIYEAKNYDNSTKVFDGHCNKNGQMQLPGTYFYQLEYTVKGIVKHKTGFVVLKY